MTENLEILNVLTVCILNLGMKKMIVNCNTNRLGSVHEDILDCI